MPIYSEELQNLTDQLVAQNAQLQTAIAASDAAGIATAADAVEATALAIDQNIKAPSDMPVDDTMVLHVTTDLLAEITVLQQAIDAVDNTAIEATAIVVDETTFSLNACVTKMEEMLPEPKEFQPPLIPI